MARVSLDLTDGVASSYNWQEQSGVGTDINMAVFALGKRHIVYMKTFAPESPIVSQLKGKLGQKAEGRLELRDGLVGNRSCRQEHDFEFILLRL